MNEGKLNPQTLKDFGNKKWSGKLNRFILTQLKYLTKKSELLDDDRCYTQPQKQLSSWRLVDITVPILVFKYGGTLLIFLDWKTILLLNSSLSDQFFCFFKNNQFNEIL